MASPSFSTTAKRAARGDVLDKLFMLPLYEGSTDVGAYMHAAVNQLVCERGMTGTLDLVEKNIERLRPWWDVVQLFLTEPVESVPRKQFFADAGDEEVITRNNVLWDFSEPGDELLRLISAKGALEYAIAVCDGKWRETFD